MQAWSAIIGNTVKGKIEGEDAYEYVLADGTTKLMIGTDIVEGKWAVVGQTICFQYPEEETECYRVEMAGKTVTFTDSQGKGTRWQLLTGNPQNL